MNLCRKFEGRKKKLSTHQCRVLITIALPVLLLVRPVVNLEQRRQIRPNDLVIQSAPLLDHLEGRYLGHLTVASVMRKNNGPGWHLGRFRREPLAGNFILHPELLADRSLAARHRGSEAFQMLRGG